jgi:hypothetical protein
MPPVVTVAARRLAKRAVQKFCSMLPGVNG